MVNPTVPCPPWIASSEGAGTGVGVGVGVAGGGGGGGGGGGATVAAGEAVAVGVGAGGDCGGGADARAVAVRIGVRVASGTADGVDVTPPVADDTDGGVGVAVASGAASTVVACGVGAGVSPSSTPSGWLAPSGSVEPTSVSTLPPDPTEGFPSELRLPSGPAPSATSRIRNGRNRDVAGSSTETSSAGVTSVGSEPDSLGIRWPPAAS